MRRCHFPFRKDDRPTTSGDDGRISGSLDRPWGSLERNLSEDTRGPHAPDTFFGNFSFRKNGTTSGTSVNGDRTLRRSAKSLASSNRDLRDDTARPLVERPRFESPHTTRNALKLALTTLSSVSSNIPLGAMLSSIINPLLAIMDRIEQTCANKQGLDELAARMQLLTPIVSEMATNKPREGKRIIEGLERELESIKNDLEDASQRGTLDQFFNSTENTSSLAKHSMILAQMIADSTLVTVHEVLKTLQDIQFEHSTLLQSPPPIPAESGPLTSISEIFDMETRERIELGDITGGLGGTGGSAKIGGEGGEGGIGGTGGEGIEIGGKGGTGKAPIIRRRN
ncbi:hypothetical protein C8R44DRAFT_930325 [Mycena epipterygia]|nr:hypothetical protein C8R44DRAFT_930325 [Mycena epipterygia]